MATPIPANVAPFTLAEVVRATGGQVLVQGEGRAVGVTTDSREEVSGRLFVALPGERYDGHRYVADVVARGASGVLVSEAREVGGGSAFVVRVPSTVRALGALAHLHRQRWGGTVVAIGGSAGKTTTRSAISALLRDLYPGAVHFARGNLNNLVGVPMVLLGVLPEHRIAVVEVGTNVPGEVGKLASITGPDLAVLTLVALEHSEGLGDLDAIEVEEGDLLGALGAAATALYNGDDPRARRQLERCAAATQIGFGTGASCDYRLVGRRLLSIGHSELTIERPGVTGRETVTVEAATVGEPGARAALAALAVADRIVGCPVAPAVATAALGRVEEYEPGRLRTVLLGDGTLVVDDTYNANPASVRSAVATALELASARGARLVLAVGEMRELGDCSRGEHARLGEDLGASGAVALVAIGGDAAGLVEPAGRAGLDAVFAADAELAVPLVLQRVRAGDVVLVKASRGVRAERVVAGLRAAKGLAS
jgi:UDP-N-acetylmuramoyl-tripeptide--D-alanyl-D-alanine ligase